MDYASELPLAVSPPRARAPWAWGAVLAMLAALLFSRSMASMFYQWMHNDNTSQGLLVPFIVAALVWDRRQRLAQVKARPARLGLALLSFGCFLQVFSVWAETSFLGPVGFVLFLIGLTWYLLGRDMLRELAFPCAFLFFMVPWPDSLVDTIAFPMQMFTTKYAVRLGKLTGLHPVRDGVNIIMPHFKLTVAVACSGMHSLMALLAMAALFAYFTRAPMWQRFVMFAMGLPMALGMNIVRVWLITVAGHVFGEAIAMRFFHEYSAFALFLLNICGLAGLKRFFEWKANPQPLASSPSQS